MGRLHIVRIGALAVGLLVLASCYATVKGGPLTSKPHDAPGLYLSTGGSHRPYRTIGFAQVTGYGVTMAGYVDAGSIGDAGLDSLIRGKMSEVCRELGGDGVIHIEFLDSNPPTEYDRAQMAAQTAQNVMSGQAGVEQEGRTIVVTGEIIVFTDGGPR